MPAANWSKSNQGWKKSSQLKFLVREAISFTNVNPSQVRRPLSQQKLTGGTKVDFSPYLYLAVTTTVFARLRLALILFGKSTESFTWNRFQPFCEFTHVSDLHFIADDWKNRKIMKSHCKEVNSRSIAAQKRFNSSKTKLTWRYIHQKKATVNYTTP